MNFLKEKIAYYQNKIQGSENISEKAMVSTVLYKIIFILFIGYLSGYFCGGLLLSCFITKANPSYLLYRPSSEYIALTYLINSRNELKRLCGYYSMLENNKIDEEFIFDKYKDEPSYIKRTLIWVLSFSKEKEKIFNFADKEFVSADKKLKNEFLKTLKRADPDMYKNFVKKHKINIDNFPLG